MSRFMSTTRQTPAYQDAVTSLTKLMTSQVLDDALRAYGEAMADAMQEEYRTWHSGPGKPRLKLAHGHPCIARLVRKRCQAFPWPNRQDYMPCRPPGADHDFLMLEEGKPHSFVTHPYDLHTEVLKEMVAFGETWGLEFAIDGFSWHFPGRTVRVIWRKAQQERDLLRLEAKSSSS